MFLFNVYRKRRGTQNADFNSFIGWKVFYFGQFLSSVYPHSRTLSHSYQVCGVCVTSSITFASSSQYINKHSATISSEISEKTELARRFRDQYSYLILFFRNNGMGFASLCSRIGGICAPFIVVSWKLLTYDHREVTACLPELYMFKASTRVFSNKTTYKIRRTRQKKLCARNT